jgi:thiamine monophosphate synthase
MNIKKTYVANIFYFTEDINEAKSENIKKFKNIAIVYQKQNVELNKFLNIQKFCLKNQIQFYIIDNFKIAIKYKLNGVVLSHSNRRNSFFSNPICHKRDFLVLGKVHNQIDFFFKQAQKCKKIFLSPIFITKKYGNSKFLNISRFNLMSINWNIDLCALGGINNINKKKMKLTKSFGYGFDNFMNDPQIKKPTYYLK